MSLLLRCGHCGWEERHQCPEGAKVLYMVFRGKPIPCPRPRLVQGRIISNTTEYKTYKKYVAQEAFYKVREWEKFLKKTWPIEDAFFVKIEIYFPDYRRRDDDNVEKTIKDALTGVVWKDDCWTHFKSVTKKSDVDKQNPRVELMVMG